MVEAGLTDVELTVAVVGDLDTGLLDRTMDDYASTPPPPAALVAAAMSRTEDRWRTGGSAAPVRRAQVATGGDDWRKIAGLGALLELRAILASELGEFEGVRLQHIRSGLFESLAEKGHFETATTDFTDLAAAEAWASRRRDHDAEAETAGA